MNVRVKSQCSRGLDNDAGSVNVPIVVNCISWLRCEIFDRVEQDRIEGLDHVLFFARVTAVGEGRLGEPPLVCSSRHGWRIADTKAREAGVSVRDELLARLAESGTT
ncbi:MAG: flavin reductase (DIM6/NTAB) family NADH-FMN oxidoreductase RutF [Acidimicrobiales bacterium]|jgi:flavin reductase (DIM6/NTAB) family NADH-FMN oxidoreductase RutF